MALATAPLTCNKVRGQTTKQEKNTERRDPKSKETKHQTRESSHHIQRGNQRQEQVHQTGKDAKPNRDHRRDTVLTNENKRSFFLGHRENQREHLATIGQCNGEVKSITLLID